MEYSGRIENSLEEYRIFLREMERCDNTIKKYMRDVRNFYAYVGETPGRPAALPRREQVLSYKEYIIGKYKISSVNSMLAALNGYLNFIGCKSCCVKQCRVQRKIFREEERELTRQEYERLVREADRQENLRLSCILQTIGSTGIRISELQYITVEAVQKRLALIRNKGKDRCIVIPGSLTRLLKSYCKKMNIESGSIFITRTGKPVDRRNVWAEMKKLCKTAGVLEEKVFPHNLRHLFARCYYEKEKDVIRLADYLGHSNVETTRRYTQISTMEACLKQLELGLLVSGMEEGTEDVIL